MFKTVFRRLSSSRWKVLSLLIGQILAIAIAFCIPVYSDGILQRILIKTLEEVQTTTGEYPSYVSMDYRIAGVKKDANYICTVLEEEFAALDAAMPMDSLVKGKYFKYEMFRRQANQGSKYENLSLTYYENLADHVNVVTGRMFDPNRSDGIVEVVINNRNLVKTFYSLNEVYEFDSLYSDEAEGIKIMIVGIIEPLDASELFWYEDFNDISGGMFVANEYFAEKIAADMSYARHLTQFTYYNAYDFYDLKTDTAETAAALYRTANDNITARLVKNQLQFNITGRHLGSFEQVINQ